MARSPFTTILRRLFQGGIVVLISSLVGFLFAEILCRIVNPLGISYFPETARYMDTLLLADGVGYRNQPNLKGTYWGAPVSVNSLGIRDEEVPLPRPANEYRILMMGDSLVFGIGVSHEQTFTHLLQLQIQQHAPAAAPRVRTIDMGVPSYNTEAELAQYEMLGSKLQPNMVVLVFTLNDIEPKMWIFNKRRDWYINWAQRSYAASFLFRSMRETVTDSLLTKPSPGTQGKGDQNDSGTATVSFGDYAAGNPRWIAIDQSMTRLHNHLKALSIPFAVFSEAGPTTPAGLLLESLSKREGFPLIPMLSDDDEVRKTPLTNSPSDGHPNPEGNRVMATQLFESLDRLHMLDPILKPTPGSF